MPTNVVTNLVVTPATNATLPPPTNLVPAPPTNVVPSVTATAVVFRPPPVPLESNQFPRPIRNTLELQWALARSGFSPGPFDGVMGSQTRNALFAFQERNRIVSSTELDSIRPLLPITESVLVQYQVSSNDLGRLQWVPKTWLGKSQQTRLDFETLPEFLGEASWSHPNLIRRLNPEVSWTNLQPGLALVMPAVRKPVLRSRITGLRIYLSQRTLQATNDSGEVLLHFPCSIAQRVEKRPLGMLTVVAVAPNPNYLFDPANFPESEEAQQLGRKLMIPPGPNNPVGTAWISLDRPGYGIHGTPRPEEVGRTESHGCFRLANWNAEILLVHIRLGLPVHVLP